MSRITQELDFFEQDATSPPEVRQGGAPLADSLAYNQVENDQLLDPSIDLNRPTITPLPDNTNVANVTLDGVEE